MKTIYIQKILFPLGPNWAQIKLTSTWEIDRTKLIKFYNKMVIM